jgi:hypothetical protein
MLDAPEKRSDTHGTTLTLFISDVSITRKHGFFATSKCGAGAINTSRTRVLFS